MKVREFAFAEGEFFMNMTENRVGDTYLLSSTLNSYFIYKIEDGRKLLISEVKVDKDPNFKATRKIATPLIFTGKYIWFLNRNIGLIQFDLNKNSLKKHKWSDLFQNILTFDKNFNPPYLQILLLKNGNFLFAFPNLKEVYQFDWKSDKLSLYHPFKQLFHPEVYQTFVNTRIHSDQSGNILFSFLAAGKDKSRPEQREVVYSLLQDTSGQMYDYTSVLGEMKQMSGSKKGLIQGFYAKDFKKQILACLDGRGLYLAQINQSYSLDYFNDEKSFRSMIELDTNQFLVNYNPGKLMRLNFETGETRILDESDGCLGNRKIPDLTQFVKDQNGDIWFPSEQQLICYRIVDMDCQSYLIGFAFKSFVFLSENQILILSNNNQLFVFDRTNEKLSPFLLNDDPVSLDGETNDIYISTDGTIWIATLEGLILIDQERQSIQQLGLSNGFSEQRIMCIHETEDGKLWLGTFGGGYKHI